MRLTTLEMQRFGKFQNKKVSLPAGLHLWQDANESGKTTTADFIRFMFYGFEKSRAKRTLAENPLEKYQPWDSAEGMSGALELVDEQGKSYRIERNLNPKGKGQVRVLDAEGRDLLIADPGEYFLGVDSETFVNIFYIRQGENSPYRTAGMDVAMKNLMTTGSEEISFDRVMKFLQVEKAKYSSPKREMGKLKNLQEEMGQLERSVAYAETALNEQRAQLSDPADTEAQIARLNEQLTHLQKEKDKIAAHKAFLRQQKRQQLQQQLQNINEQLTNTLLSEEETGLLGEAFRELERANICRQQAAEELAVLKAHPAEMLSCHETVLSHHRALDDTGAKTAVILGCVLTAAGGVGAMWSLWCLLGAAIGIFLLIMGLLKMRLPAQLRALGIRNKAELIQALSDAAAARQASQSYQSALTSAQQACDKYDAQLQSVQEKYAPLLQRTQVTDAEQLEQMRAQQASRRMLQAQLISLQEQLEELSPTALQDAKIACKQTELKDTATLEALERQAEQKKEILLRSMADNAALASRVSAQQEQLFSLQEQLSDCKEQYQKCAYLNEVAVIAIEAMEQAQKQLRDNYAPALRALVEQNLSVLTNGRYDSITLDEEFAIRIKADGGLRALDYFSQGTRDAAYLALRLSLAEIVQGERVLPLIFDDPFLNFDDERRKNLWRQLEKLAGKQQVLLFSCREF